MTDAPERIWAEEPEIFDGMGFWQERESGGLTEYVRADLCAPDPRPDPRTAALVEAAKALMHDSTWGMDHKNYVALRNALAAWEA